MSVLGRKVSFGIPERSELLGESIENDCSNSNPAGAKTVDHRAKLNKRPTGHREVASKRRRPFVLPKEEIP